MPSPTREALTRTGVDGSPASDRSALRDRALAVLTDPALADIVELVAHVDGDDVVVSAARGTARYSRSDPAAPGRVERGVDPVAHQDPFDDDTRCFPDAARRLAGLFAERRAPDLAVVHTGRHCWVDRGGHPGEHGSLNGVQSRAPLLLSGAGVGERGRVQRYARTPDVGATLAWLCGASDADLEVLDGRPLTGSVAPGARHVVGLLWDGAHCADLLAMAAAGELPAVQRLLDRGCAYTGGALAEFPSVTLVNHTSALTGVGPGRHGIVHNAYFDRDLGQRVVANDADTWHRACELLRPGVRTVWELVAGATACVNEPVDRGAAYSTFGLLRAAPGTDVRSALPDPALDPHATVEHVRADAAYAWSTQVDASGLDQVLGLWREGEPPRLTWWNTTLTDSGHHAGGPGSRIARDSLRDTDRRLGIWLDLVAERGLLDDTVVLLTADHGSEGADLGCTGDWDDALRAAGVPFRDEAYGFLYLGV